MEELITGPLAEALGLGREEFNRQFQYARSLDRNLDPAAFAEHLRSVLDPIVRAAAEVAPDKVGLVTEELFEVSLELFGRTCLGPASPYPAIKRAWRELFPAAAGLLVRDPRTFAGAVSNALYNLAQEEGANADFWLNEMARLVPVCESLDEFLKVGQVVSWRAGLAHFRAGAIEVWRQLPDRLKYESLGLSPSDDGPDTAELEKGLADPWRRPEDPGRNAPTGLALADIVGGFRGFGGRFVSPPEVTQVGEAIYVFDREHCYSLHADVFGATFRRFGPDLPENAGQGRDASFEIKEDGTVVKGEASRKFPIFKEAVSSAATRTTLAVTVPRSHKVFLVAVMADGASNDGKGKS